MLSFINSAFFLNSSNVNLLEKTDLKIAFAILTRTESWTEKAIPLIQRMRRDRLYYIAPGVESSVDAALRKFNKRGTAESNQRIFKLFQENDVYVHAYLIMFYPYVTNCSILSLLSGYGSSKELSTNSMTILFPSNIFCISINSSITFSSFFHTTLFSS